MLKASQFSDSILRTKHTDAAQLVRLPYWYWGLQRPAGENVFPALIANRRTTVIDIDGVTKTIENPWHHYNFLGDEPHESDFDTPVGPFRQRRLRLLIDVTRKVTGHSLKDIRKVIRRPLYLRMDSS